MVDTAQKSASGSISQRLAKITDTEERSLQKCKAHMDRVGRVKLPSVEFPKDHDWFNTKDDKPLTFDKDLKGKIVVVDFWSSCCINCIHVLAEMDRLEKKFAEFPEVAFVGCHSAKFENEKDTHMLRQAVIRYDIAHPVLNDREFKFWSTNGARCWPTIMIFGPGGKPIIQLTGESNEDTIQALLVAALEHYEMNDPSSLTSEPVPIVLEKDKHIEARDAKKGFVSDEQILALQQNLSNPGKVIIVKGTESNKLPYEGVNEVLIIADSSNNRFVVVDTESHKCLQVIGNGKMGYKEGSFEEAQFYHTQGMTHYINDKKEHCLIVCDVKNHLIRELNLNTKKTRHIAGKLGERGHDVKGTAERAEDQELCSPWDLVPHDEPGCYIVCMAGTHQIWKLDMNKNTCTAYSGYGGEGNCNSSPKESTWAQPSGITVAPYNGKRSYFIADSESSAIRGIYAEETKAFPLVGANGNEHDLFAFGDEDGKGYGAKLQHCLGVHYCDINDTLYIADTYNHKIKTVDLSNKDRNCQSWIGTSKEKNPRVKDGDKTSALINEPNGLWAKIKDGQLEGLYIADTGNDCIRFAKPDGTVTTVQFQGIPDVRETSSDCNSGTCDFKL